jgi:tRNA G46 methylase TrmB
MTDTKTPHLRTIKSFVKRTGRMGMRQQHALAEYAKLYQIPYIPEQTCFESYYKTAQALVIEIGFGMGDSLVTMAKNASDINFLGIEVHEPGVGNILDHILVTAQGRRPHLHLHCSTSGQISSLFYLPDKISELELGRIAYTFCSTSWTPQLEAQVLHTPVRSLHCVAG